MLLPLLGICALFGRFWGKSWEPVQGLLTDGCGCGDPRCCGNLFILCLFLLWQVRQRFRGSKNLAIKKKGSEVSLLKWAVPPWYHLAIPVPSPGLSICPCTQKRLEIHVQKLVYRQKWGPPQKLRESWVHFLLSQLSGHRGLEKSGEPGVCSPFFPSTCRCLEEYQKELHVLGGWQFAWGICNIKAHLLCKVPLSQVLEGPGWMEQTPEKLPVILPAPLSVSKEIPLPDPPPAPEKTSCHSLLSTEGPCLSEGQLVEGPEAQEPEREDQQLTSDEDTLSTQTLGVEEGLVLDEDVLEAASQINLSGVESHIYKETSFPWGPALEDTDSEASDQELEVPEESLDTTPLIQPLVQMWEGLQLLGREESLQDLHEDFPEREPKAGGGSELMPGQHQHENEQAGGTALEFSHHNTPLPGWSEDSHIMNSLPSLALPPEDSNCAPTTSDTDFKGAVILAHAVPPKRPTLKKSSRLLLESLMRRKIAHLKWGLPRRIQESEWLFQLMGASSSSDAGTQCSIPEEEETTKEESKTQEGEPPQGETAAQSSCTTEENPTCQDLSLPKAARDTPDLVLQPFIQFKESLQGYKEESQKVPMPPKKRKVKNDTACPDMRDLSDSLDGVKGPKQPPNMWGLHNLCDEALSRAMLPVIPDYLLGGISSEQTGFCIKDSPSTTLWEWRGSQEDEEEASPSSKGNSLEPQPGPSNEAQEAFSNLGSPGPGAFILSSWSQDPYNPNVFQDSQALPWTTVCHWSMPPALQTQNMSDSGGDTPQSQSSEVHPLPAEQRKRMFWSQGEKIPESGASSYSQGRTKGPFRTVAVRLSMAFMNKMPWSPRQASSATSVSNSNQCQEDPDFLREAGSSGTFQAGLPERVWDREEDEESDQRGPTRSCTSLDLERRSSAPEGSFCDDGMRESSTQSPQREQVPTKSSWVKRLRSFLTRLNFNK